MIYMITGIFSIVAGPLAGRLSDRFGKMQVFTVGSILSMIVIGIYTNMGITPVWLVCVINVCLFMAITARMIPASALMTAIPSMPDRGAFMSVNSAAMQISGGIASVIAGMIVYQQASGSLMNYDVLGYVVAGTMAIMIVMMYYINRMVSTPADAPAASSDPLPVVAVAEV
jgi:MFS family permease